ncbi:Aminotran-1-2 domain-containing protein [Aphelenchoides bicaudatus]|nr:Aminotran-1-2 domain-containing protein [Aphelenchoides bicaudatus]
MSFVLKPTDEWSGRQRRIFGSLKPLLFRNSTLKSESDGTPHEIQSDRTKTIMDSTTMSLNEINDFLNRRLPNHADIVEYKNKATNEVLNDDAAQADGKEFYEHNQDGETVHCQNEFEKCNRFVSFSVYMTWVILMVMAYFREFLRKYGFEKNLAAVERKEQWSFPPLYSSFESIYARNCYNRVRDVFERPICSVPGAKVTLLDRETDDYGWTFRFTGTKTDVINVGSYNYLGFAQNTGPCAENSEKVIDELGLSICSSVHELGQTKIQTDLESLVAEFLGVEDAMVFSMGFATNSLNVPCLLDKNSLIISDQYNHASLVLGCRLSGATIKVFKHNDVKSLEKTIRDAIAVGNPKTRKPYNKILIIVEGIYSMEGSICNLPAIIALKKKYNCYLYLDEAHSIGAMGQTGRGVVEYWGCNPRDVDVLMGTFTKSFGSAGGYIAGSKQIIDHLRATSASTFYALPMSPPVAKQIYTSMSIIMGRDNTTDGHDRIERLHRNSRYFRLKLKQKGFIVYGSDDSPVVPVMIYYPTKCGLWGREMLKRGIGVVVVSFPATEMTESRCRFCISAAHTKEQLDYALEQIDELGHLSRTKHSYRSLYKDVDIQW